MANEERVRQNFISGTTTDNPLTSGATSFNSAGLASLEAIDSAEHAVIVLDPTGAGNGPEIVYITAHTGGATSATITRGREGTSAVQHASGTGWVHGPTQSDFPGSISASSERPSTGGLPYAGQFKYEVDLHRFVYYDHVAGVWLPMAGQVPTCRAVRTGSTATIPYVTWTTINLDAETFDPNTMHSTVTNTSRITPPDPGLYRVDAACGFEGDVSGGVRGVRVRRSDGTIFASSIATATDLFDVEPCGSDLVRITAGQYLEVQAYQSGASIGLNLANSDGSSEYARLCVEYVAA